MAYHLRKSLNRLINAIVYSFNGIKSAFKNEIAFRQEVIISCILIPIVFFLDVTGIERVTLVGSVVLVMVVELLNSAIEAVVDRIGAEYHELSKRAKDMGSSAVFVSIILVLYTWTEIVLLPCLLE